MTTGHFFAGGGGCVLASEILGHESVFALDSDARRCSILRDSGWFPSMHVECCDIREFDPTPWQDRMDIAAAGFPCQDISCAGKGAGIRGERSGLVFEFFRAIDVVRPSIVFLENSPRIRTRGRREIVRELVARGYSWRDGVLAASDVGAGHRRNRWWLLAANADGKRKLEQERRITTLRGWTGDGIKEAAHIDSLRRERGTGSHNEAKGWAEFTQCVVRAVELGGLSQLDAAAIGMAAAYTGAYQWSPPDAGVRRVVDGMARRMDRIAICGDGQVPLQAAVAWGLLAWGY